MIKEAKKRIKVFLSRYINGTKGVISLFLAILMVPFASIAALLINAGRINSAVAIFDEALCNASNSTLGTYDAFLRKRFALMAMGQNTASGGTEYGRTTASYTADDLLEDVFAYYMEKNVGALSNTYHTTDLDAAGLYPLSDTSVLLSSVLQASKITVPAKMVIDWGSLDDMIAKLTKPLNLVGSFESMISSGAGVASDIDELSDKADALDNQVTACNTARTAYTNAYNDFSGAASAFNTLVNNISSAQQNVNSKQAEVDRLKAQVETLARDLEDKKAELEELEEDTRTDHSEEIEALEKEIEDLEEEIEKKSPGYNQAVTDLETAKNTLQGYVNQYSSKRQDVLDKKDAYYDAIVALRDEVNKTCTAAVNFQDAVKSLVNDAEGLITDTVSLGVDIAKHNNESRQNELQQESDECVVQADLAGKDGYPEYINHFYEIKQENDSTILHLQKDAQALENKETIINGALDAAKDANSVLVEFADRDLEREYQTIYDALDTLRLNVNNLSIPSGYTTFNYSNLYYTVNNPMEEAAAKAIIENVENEIVNNAGWAMLKALVSFVKAMFNITVAYDPELTVTINEGIYAPNGGLPSKADRSVYTLTSPYQQEDEDLSNYYKTILNTYASEDVYSTEVDAPSSFERMMGYIDTLLDLLQNFKLKNLKKIFETAGNIIKELSNTSFGDLATGLATSIRNKALLVGYVSYNTANRTTRGGKALTGASFGLPSTGAANGYVFSGAETEYIFHGSMSEKENQESVFRGLWWQRMLLNLPAILADNTVRALASGVSSITFGLGGIIVYAIFIAAEAFIDCIILVNGGNIPMVKSFVYITPPGLPKLLEALVSLNLSKALQKTIYEKSVGCAQKMEGQLGNQVALYPRYDDYTAKTKSDAGKFSNIFTWDYTKSVQLMLLLTRRSSTMLNRLADLIEMEAAYNATKGAGTYLFNLDKSFTYLRASGNFTSSVFIKVGEDSDLTSQKRVIYNGY